MIARILSFALALLAVLGASAWSTVAAAQIPQNMTVQGVLRDATGAPVEGSVDFEFELRRGTAAVWTERHTAALEAGLFTIVLGSDEPIAADLFTGAPVSLVVTVDGTEMDAIPLTTVPYAFRAASAETADEYTGDVDWGQLTGVPEGFADGSDDGSAYAAGAGLSLGAGNTFSVNYAGSGTASSAARSDHTHGWSEITSIPAGFADGVDDTGGVPLWSSIVGVPSGFADGIDDVGGPPAWSSLTGVPAGFADGTDDVGGPPAWSSLTGVPAGFADGTDDVGGPPAWSSLTGVPAGFADGVDDGGSARGVTFTRWGRGDCPTGTTLVYSGFAAGGAHDHGGSGANTLCLTSAPTWLNFSDVNQNGALVYGTEYETAGYGLASATPFNTLNDANAPCAVCLDTSADIELMIPGTAACPSGWNQRVRGYLMATFYTQGDSEFVCVDENATSSGAGGTGNENGNLWYPAEAECGSLPCGAGRYVQDRELTCSVCTR
jgi:hypothetical protein